MRKTVEGILQHPLLVRTICCSHRDWRAVRATIIPTNIYVHWSRQWASRVRLYYSIDGVHTAHTHTHNSNGSTGLRGNSIVPSLCLCYCLLRSFWGAYCKISIWMSWLTWGCHRSAATGRRHNGHIIHSPEFMAVNQRREFISATSSFVMIRILSVCCWLQIATCLFGCDRKLYCWQC